nr:putative serpin-Z8 [Aegilops tauschii subsp. strangulata]
MIPDGDGGGDDDGDDDDDHGGSSVDSAKVGAVKVEATKVDRQFSLKLKNFIIFAQFITIAVLWRWDVVTPGFFGPETYVVLANAIYFKGKWVHPFNKRKTMKRPFQRLNETTVDKHFMCNSTRHFIGVYDGFKVLRLPYKMPRYHVPANAETPTPQCSMCIFLPDAYDGLQGLVEEITSCPTFLHEHLPTRQVRVGEFGVPKFKLSSQIDVTQTLKHLGLLLPFDMGADLLDMVEDHGSGLPLLVNDIFHKATIEVNEQGTEAAAATRNRGLLGCPMLLPKVDFLADHPFAYFIVEEASGAIISAGHVVDPSSGRESQVRIGQPYRMKISEP